MSVSVLPELRLREERLRATRRRGIRHVACRPSSLKGDQSGTVVRRTKSEQKLPHVDDGVDLAVAPVSVDSRVTVEDKRDRIRAIVAAVESQKPSIAFSGHKADRRPGSGNSSMGSRSISFHSLCTQNPVPVTKGKSQPVVAQTKTKLRWKGKKGTLNLKAPVLSFTAPTVKASKPLPAVKKKLPDVRQPVRHELGPPVGVDERNELGENPVQPHPSPVREREKRPAEISKKPINRPPPRHPIPIPSDHKPGVIPKYLKKRQAEWEKEEEEERKRQEKLRAAPPGFSLMPDTERQETLESLKQKEEDLVRELVSLPVRIDTMRIQRRKLEIENQLSKIDEGIRMFSRPKVYVRHEAVK